MIRRIEAYLYSRRNIAGSILAVVGLALHFSGLIVGIQWFPITVGLYLIGALLVPGERSLVLSLDAAADAADVRTSLDRLVKQVRGRVPDDIYQRVLSIRQSILATLDASAGDLDASDPNVYLIRQTALSYLPEALNQYLAIPRAFADRSLRGRPSAHDVLLQQLVLMDGRMRDAVEAALQHDTDRLEAHGRFLAEKFGASSLDLGSTSAPAQDHSPAAATERAAVPTQPAVDQPAPAAQAKDRPRVRG